MSLFDRFLHFLRKWWPTMLCVAAIVYATMTPDPAPDLDMALIPHIDKLIHAVMFGGLAGAAAFDWQRDHRDCRIGRHQMLVICAVCIVAGGLNELAQAKLTVERAGDWYDLLADATGILVAFVAAPPAVRKVLKIS